MAVGLMRKKSKGRRDEEKKRRGWRGRKLSWSEATTALTHLNARAFQGLSYRTQR